MKWEIPVSELGECPFLLKVVFLHASKLLQNYFIILFSKLLFWLVIHTIFSHLII